jgi:cysteine desulfurase
VLAAFTACVDQVYGNASSIHQFGQAARERVENARRQVAALLHCAPASIVFTSGGTEADNMAVLGIVRAAPKAARHVVVSAIEHPAVLGPCDQLEREGVRVTRVPVRPSGIVDPDDIAKAICPETVLVSVMHANNEIGTVQPLEEISRIAASAGIPLHVDGVQAIGKITVDVDALGASAYSLSGHKLYGPKGVGALFIRKGTRIDPITFGGSHERGRRPGTENVPGIAALGAAAELAAARLKLDSAALGALRDRLENGVLSRIPGTRVNGGRVARTPNTSNICFEGLDGEALAIALDLRGFAVSTGAACSSGALHPSHVLTAMGLSAGDARSSMRFSLGRANTEEQVDALVDALAEAAAHLRKAVAPCPVPISQ